MKFERSQIIEERKRLRAQYLELYDSLSELLFRHDPIRINFEINTDEYETEVGTILPRLHGCQSLEDVQKVVYEEFVRWFDPTTAGGPDCYREIASEIWQLLLKHKLPGS